MSRRKKRVRQNALWEEASCNLCKRKNLRVLWNDVKSTENDDTFRIVSCKKCTLIFLSPRPPKSQIAVYYPKSRYWGVNLLEGTKEETTDSFLRENYGVLFDIIDKKYSRGSILDIGSGIGGFLIPYKKKGWKVSGTEFSKDAVMYARKKHGISLIAGELSKHTFAKKSFDVVTLNNVLEHLYNPLETLRIVHTLLKKEGMVVITVPNFNGIGSGIFGKKWYPLQPPIHLYHFTEESLKQMLIVAGFKPESVNHSFFVHNYYSLFQSFRFLYTKKVTGSEENASKPPSPSPKKSVLKEVGKSISAFLSFVIAKAEPYVKKGEVITIIAVKT